MQIFRLVGVLNIDPITLQYPFIGKCTDTFRIYSCYARLMRPRKGFPRS